MGLDPKNPYVTQQTNTQFLWYEFENQIYIVVSSQVRLESDGAADEDYSFAGDAKVKRRRVGARGDDGFARLAKVDSKLSCDAFTDRSWLILIAPTGRRRYAVTRSLSKRRKRRMRSLCQTDDAQGTGRT